MKKIVVMLSALAVISCASREEREFQNRQYMFGDGTNVVNQSQEPVAQSPQTTATAPEATTTVTHASNRRPRRTPPARQQTPKEDEGNTIWEYLFGKDDNVEAASQPQVEEDSDSLTFWEYLFGKDDDTQTATSSQPKEYRTASSRKPGKREGCERVPPHRAHLHTDGECIDSAPVVTVASEPLPMYEIIEPEVIVDTSVAVAEFQPEPLAAPVPVEVYAQRDVIVYDSVSEPEPMRYHQEELLEISERPRDYKKYRERDVYIVDTPQGTIDLWEETVTPEVYEIVATRTTNKMLKETGFIYDRKPVPTLYVTDVQTEDGVVDNGFYFSRKVTRDMLVGSRTFKMVSNISDADYHVEINVNSIIIDDGLDYAIQYNLRLIDSRNNLVKEWSEVIKRVQTDGSWW
ncbi:MAG: hypothetical protein LBL47_03550 [Lactobacillus sp.]|jgi:hypothetical protein|nr:hypothetical protein [Lactobacillus sp.]